MVSSTVSRSSVELTARPDLAERGELIDGAGQLAGPGLQLAEQPDVLDGDDGLVGERLDQLDLLVRERPGLRPGDHDDADGRAVAQDRDLASAR